MKKKLKSKVKKPVQPPPFIRDLFNPLKLVQVYVEYHEMPDEQMVIRCIPHIDVVSKKVKFLTVRALRLFADHLEKETLTSINQSESKVSGAV